MFADTLGFHVVCMVPDYDKEPKASVAILARALGESQAAEAAPTVGRQSAQILGNEIVKYIECHDTSKILSVHALRPGDALTVARSLGRVQDHYQQSSYEDSEEGEAEKAPHSFWSFIHLTNNGEWQGDSSRKPGRKGAAAQECWHPRTAGCLNH